MQNFLKWLGDLVFTPEGASAQSGPRIASGRPTVAQVRRRSAVLQAKREPRPASQPAADYDQDSELGSFIEDGGPGKNVYRRPVYSREDSGTHETLRILEPDSPDEGAEVGFDPYNTGTFDRSANWSRQVRK